MSERIRHSPYATPEERETAAKEYRSYLDKSTEESDRRRRDQDAKLKGLGWKKVMMERVGEEKGVYMPKPKRWWRS
jgi:hypothetical protein